MSGRNRSFLQPCDYFGAGMYSSDFYYDWMFYGFYDLFHFRLVHFGVRF